MRGEVRAPPGHFFMTRITPAHAGRSWQLYHKTHQFQDHPRACGEKDQRHPSVRRRGGSPPRMRGEAFDGIKKAAEDRITPAHAGRRKSCNGRVVSIEDHPRACGEKPQPKPPPLELEGSPPRMRGEEYLVSPDVAKPRITPAHAGRSLTVSPNRSGSRDHPRACGEKPSSSAVTCIQVGSPPRMRGEVTLCMMVTIRIGITPAHAGRR